MSAIAFRMADPALAGLFAKKWLGKSGIARTRSVKTPSIGRSYDVFEVGILSPEGEFIVKADSVYDFHECFNRLGHVIDDHDPVYVRFIICQLAKDQDPRPEQVEMFA